MKREYHADLKNVVQSPPPPVINSTHLSHSTSLSHSNKNTISNIINYIMISQCNMMTNDALQTAILPHIRAVKYQQDKVFDRLDHFQSHHVDNDRCIESEDVFKMASELSRTKDVRSLLDAYYSYNGENKFYVKRDDEENWKWKPCAFSDILDEIIEQLNEYVFKQYEVKLNNKYNVDGETDDLINFYKLNKYLLIKPLCCHARHDNEVLHLSNTVGFEEKTASFGLCEELNALFDATVADTWTMMSFRKKIEQLIQTNAETTYKMIEKLVCEIANVTV
ncbi:hypothetical protein FOA52_014465 [Chlamydomonas sp. UWO 241]|nr:hypothetical protein FOA52_014465 [Chlamydomonas sp. UWO 241]